MIRFQDGTTYQLDENIKSLKKKDDYKRGNSTLLTFGDSYFWLSEEEADALKQSDNAIDFFNAKIKNNEKY